MTTVFALTSDIRGNITSNSGLILSDTTFTMTLEAATTVSTVAPLTPGAMISGSGSLKNKVVAYIRCATNTGNTYPSAVTMTINADIGSAANAYLCGPERAITVNCGDTLYFVTSATGINIYVEFYTTI